MEEGAMAGALLGLVFGVLVGATILVVLAFILKWLWNTTLPEVLGVKTITTWQAIKIMFIASILFGGHRAVSPPDAAVDVAPAPATEQAPK